MPSGGHGGGGGSHFGGGSSFHSSAIGYGYRRRRIVPIFIGNRYFMSTAHSTKYHNIRSLAFFGLVACLFTGLFSFVSKSRASEIESDHARYIEMIEYAETHPTHQRQGIVTGTSLNDEIGRYYFTYKIKRDDDPSKWLDDGFSYALYTFYTIQDIHVGDTMTFAIDSDTVTARTDSIDFTYKNFELTDDKEYTDSIKTYKGFFVASILFGCLAVGLFVYSFAYKNKNKQQKIHSSTIEEGHKACPYCGNIVSVSAKKCDNCGVEY